MKFNEKKNNQGLVHVCNFTKLYPNISNILIDQYGLKPETKVKITFTKRIDLPNYKRYRTPFKQYFYGSVAELDKKIRRFFEEKVWKNVDKPKSAKHS